MEYAVNFTTPGTYTIWGRGYADNADADAMYVGLNGEVTNITGFAPEQWDWANTQMPGNDPATLSIETSGVYTLTAAMYEDGLRLDRLLLTTDTTFIPTGAGPAETEQLTTGSGQTTLLTRTIVYTYDHLYRLTEADYSTGEYFGYAYDPMGNQTAITETIEGTIVTTYTYNAANQLLTARASDDGIVWHYTHDANGNLLRQTPGGTNPAEGETRYSYDAANRLVQVELYTGGGYTLLSEAEYNGDGERVALTTYALGVPQTVNYVVGQNGQLLVSADGSEETLYLHGRSLIAEYGSEWSYPLNDGAGSVRQTANAAGDITLARSYKPFGGMLQEEGVYETAFGFMGGQLDRLSGLLYANGRYYDPSTGRYLTPDHRFDPYRPGTLNPYAPWQGPGLWLLLPLVGLVFLRRRKDGPWRMLVLVLALGFSLSLVSCGGTGTPPAPPLEPPTTPTTQPTPQYSLSDSRYWYSERYGWFDTSHTSFVDEATRVFERVKQKRDGGPVYVQGGVEGQVTKMGITVTAGFGFGAEYEILKPLTDDQIEGVTLGILQDFSIEFEHAQLSIIHKAGQGSLVTWFANEDLPSNQIGAIAAIKGVPVEQLLIETLGARPSADEPPSSGHYNDPSRNFEFRPLILDDSGIYRHVDFPSECWLQPIGSESGLWRRNKTEGWQTVEGVKIGSAEDWPGVLDTTDPRGWPEVKDAMGYIEGVQQ